MTVENKTKSRAYVLITVESGTVDYQARGDVEVALVDFDRHNVDRSFPEDVQQDIDRLRVFPPNFPWVNDTIRRLSSLRRDVVAAIVNVKEEQDGHR